MEKGTGNMSNIEWTDKTWITVTGCNKVSPGCKNCYAERLTNRLQLMHSHKYGKGFGKVILHHSALDKPYHYKTPKKIFVNSMSDTFHTDVPETFIQEIFTVMNKTHWHQFQVLTKRPDRLVKLSKALPWTPNIWMGVSIETEDYIHRMDLLKSTDAYIKWLSLEPLLGPLPDLDLGGIGWVVVGGESGPGARPMDEAWVQEILDQCNDASVPFFFKQWGGVNKKKTGRILNGRTYDNYPKFKFNPVPSQKERTALRLAHRIVSTP